MNCHEFDTREAWRDAIEPALRLAIADDLTADDAAGPWVVFGDEIGLGLASDMYAVANPAIWKTFRNQVPRLGDKPGPVILLNWQMIMGDFSEDIHAATALAAHELAHMFDFGSLRGSRPGTAEREAETSQVVRELLITCNPSGADREQMERLGLSEMKFARRIIHLADRMIRMGWRVPLAYACEWGGPVWPLLDALDSELKELADKSIREIDAIPVPARFEELWKPGP